MEEAPVSVLSDEDYAALLDHQDGRCAICGIIPSEFLQLAVDHDHLTGEIRGLLCTRCNLLIGYLKENVRWLRRSAEYLESPPSRDVFPEDEPRWWPDSPGEAGYDLRRSLYS